jgi:hypothetical protein
MGKRIIFAIVVSLLLIEGVAGCGPKYPPGTYNFDAFVACTGSTTKTLYLLASKEAFPFKSAEFRTSEGWFPMECHPMDSKTWSCVADNLVPYFVTPGLPQEYSLRVTAYDPSSPNGIFIREGIVAVVEPCVLANTGVDIQLSCPADKVFHAEITSPFVNVGIPYLIQTQGVGWECIQHDSYHIGCSIPVTWDPHDPLTEILIQFHRQVGETVPSVYYAFTPDCGGVTFSGVLNCDQTNGYKLTLQYNPETLTIKNVSDPNDLTCTSVPGVTTCAMPLPVHRFMPNFTLVSFAYYSIPNFVASHKLYVPIPNCLTPASVESMEFEMGDIGCHSSSQVFVMVKLPKNLSDPQILSSLEVKDCNTSYRCYPLESDPNTLYCIGNKPQLNPVSCNVQACVQQNGHEVCQTLPAATPLDCPSEMKPPDVSTNCSAFGSQPQCKAAGCVWHFATAGAPYCSNK